MPEPFRLFTAIQAGVCPRGNFVRRKMEGSKEPSFPEKRFVRLVFGKNGGMENHKAFRLNASKTQTILNYPQNVPLEQLIRWEYLNP